ncbi:MAG TPA: glutamate--tRNA ligase [Longimicrobiaceae bacterium]
MTVRTRIAPSPTGDPHVGTAYIALFNYCFAKKNGGQFLLRIEDTDRERSTPESEAMIIDALRWLGLHWDEGPEVGGSCAPYRQSERGEIYLAHVERLLESGHAFRCFCTAERLDALRREQRAAGQSLLGYDGRCASLPREESERRAAAGEQHTVRMTVPRDEQIVVHDLLRGPVSFEAQSVDMQVLMKADGMPTYHLANVVDDHLMGITHVIRGEEWIPSVPKHVLLYRYFGWEPPQFCHLPLLRNPDKSKLSKRKNPTSILFYRRMGYLPEALVNYLGRMAWSLPSDEEKFSLDEMVEHFDLNRISLGGPVFDPEKLTWLNGRWIRENLDVAEYARRVQEWTLNRDYLMSIAPLTQQRVERFSDLAALTSFFFSGLLDPTPQSLVAGKLGIDEVRRILDALIIKLDAILDWRAEPILAAARAVADEVGVKFKELLKPVYVAVTGRPAGVPLFDAMAILGKDLCRARIRQAREVLGAVRAPGDGAEGVD